MIMSSLNSKTALVTGASRGMGRASALALAAAGAQVLVHYGRGVKEAPVLGEGSSVILVSSLGAHAAVGTLSAYAATKGAIDMLVKYFAAALGARGTLGCPARRSNQSQVAKRSPDVRDQVSRLTACSWTASTPWAFSCARRNCSRVDLVVL
jgi:NAD(P)-dependent dehydrogenase (short-subunit alcohol dehydrogenase family)